MHMSKLRMMVGAAPLTTRRRPADAFRKGLHALRLLSEDNSYVARAHPRRRKLMRRKVIAVVAALAAVSAVTGVALASGGTSASSRLDDGQDLLGQAKITERQAIAAAQTAASGQLNEVDLERHDGRLVFTVDVGSHDVKVDATTGDVVSSAEDD
jgi:uncharacterized membrane protein YkoI